MDIVDALNPERSEVERFTSEDRIMTIDRYAFKFDMLKNKHIFRLPRASGGDLLVDEEFRKLVEGHRLAGLVFRPITMAND